MITTITLTDSEFGTRVFDVVPRPVSDAPVFDGVQKVFCPGTVTVMRGSSVVVGHNTAFRLSLAPGDVLAVGEEVHRVKEVVNDNCVYTEMWGRSYSFAPYDVLRKVN